MESETRPTIKFKILEIPVTVKKEEKEDYGDFKWQKPKFKKDMEKENEQKGGDHENLTE